MSLPKPSRGIPCARLQARGDGAEPIDPNGTIPRHRPFERVCPLKSRDVASCSKDVLREREMANGVIQDILERSIDELPDDLRTVFVACVVDGMMPEHCAQLFSITSEAVEVRLHKARNLLIDVLMRQIGPAFGSVYQLDDSRSEHIANAVMGRLFPRG